jgi:membrane-bound lytic murein transglycosylase D
MMSDRPVKLNDDAVRAIKTYVERYVRTLRDPAHSSDVSGAYERAQPYIPLIARSFAARKVPIIIGIYLPMIESGYRECFESSLGGKGLYQFLPDTARYYGVARDEMCDVEKMTPAAAHYIADHMAELGEDSESVTLVLVSYNRGAQWVRNTLRQLRATQNYERNFWTLLANRDALDESFRRETAGYVPSFFAAAIIGENPRNFGLKMPPLSTLARSDASR